ncbi:hypothetical protein [Rubinisphaera italica]|uniref:Lipoprotein n=1 Tax=Rubinisphaera italica TaxID=2527969 RepID=A0A5C5XM24_9PLAN|nr:hypothetical protein [Rubinisphaera italica]TWT63609.1 hypothetical protein Pan54_43630 [Rubinisphaera italica]
MHKTLILTSLLLLGLGCDDFAARQAARQYKADKDRRDQEVKDLKELGLEMHKKNAALPESTSSEAPESTSDPSQ